MPEWVKVRADFRPMPQGFALLDKANLASAAGGDTSWTYPTLPAGWNSRAENPVRFRKDASGFVHVHGTAQKGSGSYAVVGTLFNLPAGYRPFADGSGGLPTRLRLLCYGSDGGWAAVELTSAGDVAFPNHLAAVGDWVELSPICFLAEN